MRLIFVNGVSTGRETVLTGNKRVALLLPVGEG